MILISILKCFLLLFILKNITKVQSEDDPTHGSHLRCYVGQKIQYWNEEWVENLMAIKCGLSYCSNMTVINTNRNESGKVVIEYSCGGDTLALCDNVTNACLSAGVHNITTCCCDKDLCNTSTFLNSSFSLLLLVFLTQLL
uniref:UPAR/Ly6 domain-containing protein n=1 Tax=Strongyloides papillosus TaxID=174720 RepID=A0A0N5C0X9_STREA